MFRLKVKEHSGPVVHNEKSFNCVTIALWISNETNDWKQSKKMKLLKSQNVFPWGSQSTTANNNNKRTNESAGRISHRYIVRLGRRAFNLFSSLRLTCVLCGRTQNASTHSVIDWTFGLACWSPDHFSRGSWGLVQRHEKKIIRWDDERVDLRWSHHRQAGSGARNEDENAANRLTNLLKSLFRETEINSSFG